MLQSHHPKAIHIICVAECGEVDLSCGHGSQDDSPVFVLPQSLWDLGVSPQQAVVPLERAAEVGTS